MRRARSYFRIIRFCRCVRAESSSIASIVFERFAVFPGNDSSRANRVRVFAFGRMYVRRLKFVRDATRRLRTHLSSTRNRIEPTIYDSPACPAGLRAGFYAFPRAARTNPVIGDTRRVNTSPAVLAPANPSVPSIPVGRPFVTRSLSSGRGDANEARPLRVYR